MNKKTVKVLVPAGALGIPFDKNALINGIKQKPDLIAIDGGSTDSGPYYLGSGGIVVHDLNSKSNHELKLF